jgi:transcriptional regulator with XRE-family HTH domain
MKYETTPAQIALGKKLKELRIKKNLTFGQTGILLGKSKGYVHYIEAGKVNLTLKNIISFSELYKCKLSQIFKGI